MGKNAFVLGKIRALRPDVVILFAAWGQHSSSWRPADPATIALQRTVHTLHDLGVTRIVLVGPAPQWEQTLPRIMINASWRDPRRELPRRTTHGLNPMIEGIDRAMEGSLSGSGAVYASAWRELCTGDGCLTHVDDRPDGLTSWDYGHLTTAGATYLAHRLPILR